MTTTTFRVGCRFVYPMYINSSGYNRSSHHTYAEHPNVPKYILRRSMASGRNHFITKGSNKVSNIVMNGYCRGRGNLG